HKHVWRTKPRLNSPRRAVYLFLKSHAILKRMAGEEKPKIFENGRDMILSLGVIVIGMLAVVGATGLCTINPETSDLSAVREVDGEAFLDLRSEEHTSELQSRFDLVCRLLLEKKN